LYFRTASGSLAPQNLSVSGTPALGRTQRFCRFGQPRGGPSRHMILLWYIIPEQNPASTPPGDFCSDILYRSIIFYATAQHRMLKILRDGAASDAQDCTRRRTIGYANLENASPMTGIWRTKPLSSGRATKPVLIDSFFAEKIDYPKIHVGP